jgi:hypothetical protein
LWWVFAATQPIGQEEEEEEERAKQESEERSNVPVREREIASSMPSTEARKRTNRDRQEGR